ncbi:hypothetical protein FRB91_004775, partial [Serendipita sp. 411]
MAKSLRCLANLIPACLTPPFLTILIVYAELKQTQEDPNALRFNCAQRAHENMLEHLPIFLAGLAWTGIRYPLISSALGLSWIMARFFYTRGYTSENPGN